MDELSSEKTSTGFGRAGGSPASKVLFVVMAIALLGLVGTLVYLSSVPYPGNKFTEFYIVGMQGKAENYPTNLKLGEDGKIIVVIVNREHETVDYSVEVVINGIAEKKIGAISLPDGGVWQQEISFTPTMSGSNQKVEFLLYRKGESTPYRGPLSLWINVS